MILKPIADWVKSFPDAALTLALWFCALIAAIVAMRGSRLHKGILLAWFLVP